VTGRTAIGAGREMRFCGSAPGQSLSRLPRHELQLEQQLPAGNSTKAPRS
jgi:hypothetical protein